MFQFWSEAFVTTLCGVILGLVIAISCLPFFNQIAGKELIFYPSLNIILCLFLVLIFAGFVSGVYPALVLSGFRPINTLRGNATSGPISKSSVLSWLVGFQFGLSVALIICTGIMQNQMSFLHNKDLGYDKSQIITFPYNVSGQNLGEMWADGKQLQKRLEDNLVSNSSILGIASSSHVFGVNGWVNIGYTDNEQERFRKFSVVQVDDNFLPMMGINIKEGRNFSHEIATDDKAVIINQAMVREYNLSNPVGQFLPEPFEEFRIIGTTEDFNFSSLHNPIAPLVVSYDLLTMARKASDLTSSDSPNPKFSVKVATEDLAGTIREIENVWKEIAPGQSFDYSFMDDNIHHQYRSESKLSSILSWSAILAIVIACMGLFGISALKIAHKTKEIGIRKILGASTSGLWGWLSYDYLKLIIIAAFIASPLAWYVMSKWLEDFAFHVDIEWWVFLLATGLTAFIALATVSFQSIKASQANPVNSLRIER